MCRFLKALSRIGLFSLTTILSFPVIAHSALMFEIGRINDTVANVTATGVLDPGLPGGNPQSLSFLDPFDVGPMAFDNRWVLHSSTMQVGALPIDFSNLLGPDYPRASGDAWLYMGNSVPTSLVPGSSVTGSLFWTLPIGLTFAPIGSSGIVNWGFATEGVAAGEWRMVETSVPAPPSPVPIPEPATVILLGSGLGLLGFIARRETARHR